MQEDWKVVITKNEMTMCEVPEIISFVLTEGPLSCQVMCSGNKQENIRENLKSNEGLFL